MKKIYALMFAASAMLALGGCTKDTLEPNAPLEPTNKFRIITASVEQHQQDDTRTSLSGAQVFWSKTDVIRVMTFSNPDKDGNYADCQLVAGEGTPNGTFKVEGITTSGKQMALYPAVSYLHSVDNKLYLDIPATQTYKLGSFGEGANPMFGVIAAKGDNIKFKNAAGAIRLKIKGANEAVKYTVTHINFTSADKGVAGDCNIDIAEDKIGEPTMIANDDTKSLSLTNINEELGAEAKEFIFVLPAGVYGAGSTFTITTTDGEVMIQTTKSPITVVRSQITPLTVFTYKQSNNHFPDPVFRAYLKDQGLVLSDEGQATEYIDPTNQINMAKFESVKKIDCDNMNISNLEGIQFFTKLISLDCSSTSIKTLDVSKLTQLTTLECRRTTISKLDLSANTELSKLSCSETGITALDLSKNTKLRYLNCSDTGITALDLSKNIGLEDINSNSTKITMLDLSTNTVLTGLACSDTGITALDLSKNTKLTALFCSYTGITALDMSKNTMLTSLVCETTKITALDLSNNPALYYISCYDSKVTNITMPSSCKLSVMSCHGNHLTTFDLSANETIIDKSAFTIGAQTDATNGKPITITAKVTPEQKAVPLEDVNGKNARVNLVTN